MNAHTPVSRNLALLGFLAAFAFQAVGCVQGVDSQTVCGIFKTKHGGSFLPQGTVVTIRQEWVKIDDGVENARLLGEQIDQGQVDGKGQFCTVYSMSEETKVSSIKTLEATVQIKGGPIVLIQGQKDGLTLTEVDDAPFVTVPFELDRPNGVAPASLGTEEDGNQE